MFVTTGTRPSTTPRDRTSSVRQPSQRRLYRGDAFHPGLTSSYRVHREGFALVRHGGAQEGHAVVAGRVGGIPCRSRVRRHPIAPSPRPPRVVKILRDPDFARQIVPSGKEHVREHTDPASPRDDLLLFAKLLRGIRERTETRGDPGAQRTNGSCGSNRGPGAFLACESASEVLHWGRVS